MDQLKQEELNEIESQLRFPQGENGIEMAKMMNDTNITMTLETIKALDIHNNHKILEMGHGNCDHLNEILNKGHNLIYSGLEISDTMYAEACRINKEKVSNKSASFHLYDGDNIPFEADTFDRIMTVNTLYFWKSPIDLLNELHRVLTPKGLAVITFAKSEFMEGLPFVQDKFNLYSNQKAKDLVNLSQLKLVSILDKSDHVKSKIGDMVNRKFSVMILEKP